MRLLFLSWPHLPLRLERAARPLPGELVVLGGRPWEAGTVLDCTPAARARGVRRGMPLGAAHKLAPEAEFLTPDPAAYRAAAEAALDALRAFAPFVEGAIDPASDAFGSVFLGIEGLERLWGDDAALLGRVVDALAPILPGPPRAGIGGSKFAAQAAATVARERHPGLAWYAVPPGGPAAEAAFLASLPIALLPASPQTHERLRVFGLRRVGDVARLPRSAVVARFGAEGGMLHDLASGRDGRRLIPRRPPERLRAEAELDPPVELLEPLRFVLHRLADVLCTQLAARGAGATSARLELPIESSYPGSAPPPFVIGQALPGPTSHAEPIERLLLARLEAGPPPGPVVRMALELDGVGPAAARQLGLFEPQAARAARLDWQLAGLAIRFGGGSILRASLRDPDAHLSEERVVWAPALGPRDDPPVGPAR